MAVLEELFDRFRQRGDLAALGEVFDRTAPALLRIALHLCGNRADAEDAVQATYLRAIEAAAAFDANRPLTPWLVGILGNRVRHRRAHANRRPERDQFVEPACHDDPLAHAMRSELGVAVTATIGLLPEHYRPVLRLHLLDGRDSGEIAATLGRRPGTVRSQLARGLHALRRLLPAGFAAGVARAQLAACLPRLREAVLIAGGAPAGAVSLAGSAVLGVLVMKQLMVGVVVVAAAVCWFLWGGGWPGPAPGTVHDASAPTTVAAAAVAPTPSEAVAIESPGTTSGAAADRIAVASTPEPTAAASGTLRVRTRWQSDATPAAAIPIFVQPYRDGARVFAQWQLTTGADGVAVFQQLPAGRVAVSTGRTEYADETVVAIAADQTAEHTIEVGGVSVSGIVVDAANRPVADARIVVEASTVRELGRSGADGRFMLRGIGPETKVGARASGHAPAAPQRIPPVQHGRIGELRIVLPGAGGRLVCTVVAASGSPVREALVIVGPRTGSTSVGKPAAAEWVLPVEQHVETVFDGVPVGEVDVVAWAEERSPWRGVATITAGATTELRIALQPGASLHGTVRDASGSPLAGCEVAIGRAKSSAYARFGRFAYQFTKTDAEGRYRFGGLPEGTIDAVADRGAAAAAVAIDAAAGAAVQWDPVLVVGKDLVGQVVRADGRGVAAAVEGSSRDRRGVQLHAFADAEGHFTLHDVTPGERVKLDVRIDYFPVARFEGPLPRDGKLVLQVADDAVPSVRIAGLVVDDLDRPLPMANVGVLRRNVGNSPIFTTGDDGRFDVGAFPPGDYRLFVEAEGRARTLTDWMTIAPQATADAGRIRLEPAGSVEVHLGSATPLPENLHLTLRTARGEWSGHVEVRNGKGERTDLAAGSYELLILHKHLAIVRQEFSVQSDSRTRIDLVVESGVPTTITLRSDSGDLPKLVRAEIRAADGNLLLDAASSVPDNGRIFPVGFGLSPGNYRVIVREPEGGRQLGERAFAVLAGSSECPIEVVIPGK